MTAVDAGNEAWRAVYRFARERAERDGKRRRVFSMRLSTGEVCWMYCKASTTSALARKVNQG